MWVLAVAAMMASSVTLISGAHEAVQRDKPQDAMLRQMDAGRIALFKMAADIYIAANPTAYGDIYWNTIKTVPSMPSALFGATFPSNWKIVANGSGAYTLCAYVRDGASQHLGKSLPLVNGVTGQYAGGGKIVFVSNASTVSTEAAKC